jgi:hypothetical protein
MINKLIRWYKIRSLNAQLAECDYYMMCATDYSYSDYKRDTDIIIDQLQKLGYE